MAVSFYKLLSSARRFHTALELTKPLRLIVAVLVGFLGFAPVWWLLLRVMDEALAGATAFAIGLVGLPTLVLVLWKVRTPLEAAAVSGKLQVDSYMVECGIEVEETEDEGRHFFLGLADGRTLFLTGQYLYEPCESGAFPSSAIAINWNKASGYSLGVDSGGDRIPVQIHPEFNISALQDGLPNDRQLFPDGIDDVAARYGVTVAPADTLTSVGAKDASAVQLRR